MGRYFPSSTPAGSELALYATWCTAVEGNTTFYGLPTVATVQRWAARAPSDFRFCFKVPREITHVRRLRHVGDELASFVDRLEPLADRLGPTSIQLPSSFGPDDLPALDRFLADLPEAVPWGVEVRHRAFEAEGASERALNDLLHGRGVERVLIDTRGVFAGPRETPAEIEAWDRKPRLRVRPVALGPNPVVRFVGLTDPARNPTWWARWVPVVARWLGEGREPIFFVHTPDNEWAPTLARRFHEEVAAVVPGLDPLPQPSRDHDQESLFDWSG